MNDVTQEVRIGTLLALRPATFDDIPEINALQISSTRYLNSADYDPEQIEAAVQYFLGADPRLIEDGTYYVVTVGECIVGCGGWSRYEAMFNNTHPTQPQNYRVISPLKGAAKIRLMYVHPDYARRGIASIIMQNNIASSYFRGYRRMELIATLTAIPLYERFGFEIEDTVSFTLPNDVSFDAVKMTLNMK